MMSIANATLIKTQRTVTPSPTFKTMAAYARVAGPSSRRIRTAVFAKFLPFARESSVTPLATVRLLVSSSGVDNKLTVRLSKVVAQHGTNLTMSRREAERCIRNGDVTVAGQVVTSPHFLVHWKDATSTIKVEGKLLRVEQKPQKTRVWIVHKLSGEVVSERDPQGRPSLVDRLKRSGLGLHLMPIGRLDMTTEGLILLTTDGAYARELELPRNHVHRTYRVRVHGKLTPHKLKAMRSGITINSARYNGMQVQLEDTGRKGASSTNTWIRMTCTEGKNRQIRNVLSHLGLTVTRLIRISYGDYQLQTIPPGMALEVPMKALSQQRHQGPPLTKKRNPKKKETTKIMSESRSAAPVQWVTHA